jgi:formylglycine-generating enzyme required for sulfatase activity
MESARNGMNLVILDACRNNPFARSFRNAAQGLATLNAPSGTFISYATAPGSVASDGSGKNGLYTGELVRHMKTPGLKLEEVFKRVRADVQDQSGDKQVPWDASSLTGDFYFVPPTVAPDSAPEVTGTAAETDSASTPKVSAAPRKFRADEEAWELMKGSNDPDDFKYFLEEFPESPLSSVARLKLRKFKKAQKKLAAKQKPVSSSQSAIISPSKPKNSVESSLPQKNISIKEGFEKCEGRDFCLRKVANTNSMTLFSLNRMAKVYGWKGTDKEKQNLKSESLKEKYEKCIGNDNCLRSVASSQYMTLPNLNRMAKVYGWKGAEPQLAKAQPSATTTSSQIRLAYEQATKQNTTEAYQRFINAHQRLPKAKFYVKRAKTRLQTLQDAITPRYVGEFRGGKRHGQGTAFYADGGKYVGEWKDDEINGYGTYSLGKGKYEGVIYQGEFKFNNIDGKGTITLPDGRKIKGKIRYDTEAKDACKMFYVHFIDDCLFIVNGTVYDKYGKVIGTFSDNVFTKQEKEAAPLDFDLDDLEAVRELTDAERKEDQAALRQKQESAGEWTESITGMKFRRIPGGSFRMGSPTTEEGREDDETPHAVSVGEFWLGETAVTLGQFRRFVRDSGHRPQSESMGCWWWTGSKWEESKSKNWRSPGFSQLDSQPVVCVSWNDASAYAKWLSRKTGKRFRLPTESEWEYAARAGTQTSRYWGEAIGRNRANCSECGSRWDGKQPAPVGSFSPNTFGLHDMLGNVFEWTCSQYKKSYDGSEQKCSVYADNYSLRGGSWSSRPGWVRAAYRDNFNFPDFRDNYIGFRLAQD